MEQSNRKGIIAIAIIILLVPFIKEIWSAENSNIINNIESCQEVEIIEEKSYKKMFKTFSCWYHTNSNGEIWWWTCIHANFNKNWECTKLTMYNKDELYKIDWWNLFESWSISVVEETNPYAHIWDKYYNIKKKQEWCDSGGQHINEDGECTRNLEKFLMDTWIYTTSWEYDYYNGLNKFKEKDFTWAIEYFDNAIEINPQFKDTYNKKGVAYFMLDNDIEALESFNKAIELDPNYIEAYYYRGLIKYFLSNYPDAIQDYNKVINTNSWYIMEAYRWRWNVYIQLSDFKRWCEDYYQAKTLWDNTVEEDIEQWCR